MIHGVGGALGLSLGSIQPTDGLDGVAIGRRFPNAYGAIGGIKGSGVPVLTGIVGVGFKPTT
jgi:hypothetical protein